uniref:Baseplate structural protein n=1 Tax=virus sp. ctOZh10 TaxID=2828250 RepID=A0A8S5RAZ9_9VIRU|nr:MAG TPA: Baseplate structural protein [virus sp. ctOZh10]
MNIVRYKQTGGFPLDTNNLDFLQSSFHILNTLGNLAGDMVIISGCEITGNTVSNGVVYVNKEVLEFRGGSLSANIFIKEEAVSGTFEDGSFKPIEITRYVTFGSSTPEKTFKWEDFKRVDNLIQQGVKNADFEKRIKALENKKSPVPIGLIAIWGKPASEPIPEGWKECTDLRGRMPLGWNPDDADFSELLKNDGEKTHQLKVHELPVIEGGFETVTHMSRLGTGVVRGVSGGQAQIAGGASQWLHEQMELKFGGNQPHNNMPPYRIIKFIEFVGFE